MQTRLQKKQTQCAICYDKITIRGDIGVCSHQFCFLCINQWSKHENTCPVCKRRFKSISDQPTRCIYKQGRVKNKKIVVQKKNQGQIAQSRIIQVLERIPFGTLINFDSELLFLQRLFSLAEAQDEELD